MSRSFEISTRREKKGKTVLIARGQRNPITVGIDYKIVCVNDFHAESGLASLKQKVKKESNQQIGPDCLKRNSNDKKAKSKFK